MEHTESKLVCKKLDKSDQIGWMVYEREINAEWIYIKDIRNKYGKLFSSPISNFFKEVFLPQGFPDSVHSDYVPYQIWDTVQAFASTILGTLTTHSIMRGVGVGESTATPLAAAITWILKDGTGMIGRIMFAWWNGPGLDAQCKKWRLFADVLNDLAMGIELVLPYFSRYSTVLLCFSSGMKSLVGVAGGATRAAITQHQALRNNLADVSAKDGSQETCVNLIASLVGVFMLSFLNASSYVAVWYGVLVTIHIYANYKAVRSLCFNTFNEDRLALLIKNYLTEAKILSPKDINERESVLLLHRASKKLCGFDIVIGESLEEFIESAKLEPDKSAILMKALSEFHVMRSIVVGRDEAIKSLNITLPDIKNQTIYVALYDDVTPKEILNAYFKAFLWGIYLSMDLDLRPDIIREAKTTDGLLSVMFKRLKILRGNQCDIVDFLDHLFSRAITEWTQLLDNSEWTRETNLLPVGPYRSHGDLMVLNRKGD